MWWNVMELSKRLGSDRNEFLRFLRNSFVREGVFLVGWLFGVHFSQRISIASSSSQVVSLP